MRILDRSVYVGPSHYAHFPVIRLELDLGELEAWPTGRLGAGLRRRARRGPARPRRARLLLSRARRLLPAHARRRGHLARPRARARRDRAAERRRRGRHLRQDAQHRTTPGRLHRRLRIRAARRRRRGRRAGAAAAVLAAARGAPARAAACPRAGAGPRRATSSSASRSAARSVRRPPRWCAPPEARSIPWLRLNDQSLVQLGHGKYQQRIQATVTGRTPHIAVELASDKEETNKILGVARPAGAAPGAGAERARRPCAPRAASAIPVVTKPYNGNHGRGISIRLTTRRRRSRAGFVVAREHSRSVIVETFLEGDDHRLLVVNGELVAATRRTPGPRGRRRRRTRSSQLIEIVNQDPRRGVGHEKVLTRLELDAQAEKMLARAGLTARLGAGGGRRSSTCARPRTSRPAARRPTSPTSSTPTTATWRCARCARSASTSAASTSCRPTSPRATATIGGGICEVNAAPGFRMHVAPTRGHAARRRRPGDRHAVPAGHAVARADRGDHRHQRQDHHRAHARAHHEDGRLHAGPHHHRRRLHRRPAHGAGRHDRARCPRAWCSPTRRSTSRCSRPRAAACCAPAWACSEVNVGAVLNVQSDHLGLKGIDTLEQLAEVKRVVVEVATDCAVLNADDPLVLQDVRLHRRGEHLLRDDEPAARAGARAHPRRRPRLRARGGRQRPDDHALRQAAATSRCSGRT